MHLSHSFLFILLVCFLFISTPLISLPPTTIFNTLLLCPLSISRLPSLFSSLCLPREKRFCLLLVSAPSQSAFLISSYCFCLIFKCYPGPNGNPYKKKSEKGESEGNRNRLGIVSLQDHKTKAPPSGKDLESLGAEGLEDGSQVQSKGVTYFRGVSWPPVLLYNLFISFSLYLLSPDLPISFFPCSHSSPYF